MKFCWILFVYGEWLVGEFLFVWLYVVLFVLIECVFLVGMVVIWLYDKFMVLEDFM